MNGNAAIFYERPNIVAFISAHFHSCLDRYNSGTRVRKKELHITFLAGKFFLRTQNLNVLSVIVTRKVIENSDQQANMIRGYKSNKMLYRIKL
jgi:hypothetical protein